MCVQQRPLLGAAFAGVTVFFAAATTAATSLAQTSPAPSTPPSPTSTQAASASGPADRRAEALAHFEKGNVLFKANALAAALAEFLQSRALYPTRSATGNAALCLTRLQRFDEALDMYESLLKEFGELPANTKIEAQREVIRLRGLVGTLEIDGGELGAAILVDERARGELPALAPLRVTAGSHTVRVIKEGFEPFVSHVDVAGKQTLRVKVTMRPLVRSGVLRVAEQSNRALDVIIDGNLVGKTPWQGRLPVGDHVVVLRGEGDLGTPPISVPVELNKTTPVSLVAEELTARLRIEPAPVSASAAVDAVIVGRGVWEGRLRAGAHKVEIAAPGFVPSVLQVSIARGERRVLTVTLERDPTSPFWPKPPRRPRFLAELGTSLALAPTFGGDIAGGCSGSCSRTTGFGGNGVVRGGYELGSGFGFGLSVGYLTATQEVTGRATSMNAVGVSAPNSGVADDRLELRGPFAGAWAGLSLGERFPVHLRLGTGAFLGLIDDARTGAFTSSGGEVYHVGTVVETHSANFFFVAPEVRVGLPLSRHAELSLGLEAILLISSSAPKWGPPSSSDEAHPIYAGPDGYGTFNADALVDGVLVVLVPGVGARYDF